MRAPGCGGEALEDGGGGTGGGGVSQFIFFKTAFMF
jgi:hypothetical protein